VRRARIRKAEVVKAVWEVEALPGFTLMCPRRPPLWTRLGIWLWFGLRGRDVK